MDYSDAAFNQIFDTVKTIAVVGVSANPVRPSYYVARYLALKGYTVIPVNPREVGKTLFGQTCVGSLNDILCKVDMVDIFRRPEFVPDIVDAAISAFPDLKVIWMQIGVEHGQAAEKARAHGITVVENRCPKIEYQRLRGELRMGGFATGVISSKLP
ncbi:CoA-binding protein [Nereida sp. MMG025]|uniref:CoA-binding protein n=1 Tax=Nereida sp. MMG025 TaxID=2909981 RepID=UPI001F304246|nr:CoA-binding protein [Nereida sp. MMG025]MCF6445202.1 CoA-binding protein [Nereida sp. MMG025]